MIVNLTRRSFVVAAAAAVLLTATPAFAATVTDQIVAQLRDIGFRDFKVSETWLGRVRIVAESSKYRREIIVDPRTGEILRDLWTTLDGSPAAAQISTSGGSVDGGGNSGSGSGDDDGEDDDNSGSGGDSGSDDDDEDDDDSDDDGDDDDSDDGDDDGEDD